MTQTNHRNCFVDDDDFVDFDEIVQVLPDHRGFADFAGTFGLLGHGVLGLGLWTGLGN